MTMNQKKTRAKMLAIIISLAMIFTMMPQIVMADAQESGSLSDTLSWKVEEGVLTISGTGDMPDYKFDTENNTTFNYYGQPWFGLDFNKIVVEEGVTGIGNHAFAGLGDVHEAVLPSTLKKIGTAAFDMCGNKGDETTYLKVDLPDGLESMGESAFENSGVKSVRFPDSLKEIPAHSFSGCPLNEVFFGNQEIISNFAFYGCVGIKKVKLPPTLKVLGGLALSQTAIEELILPDGLTTLGSEWKSEDGETGEYPGIADMPSLKRIVVPASLEKIYGANGLFATCGNLNVIAYKGTKEQWDELSKGLDPKLLPENLNIEYDYVEPHQHDWKEPTFEYFNYVNFVGYYGSCKATLVCKDDESHTKTVFANRAKGELEEAPTCTKPGTYVVRYYFGENEEEYETEENLWLTEKSVMRQNRDALGHDWKRINAENSPKWSYDTTKDPAKNPEYFQMTCDYKCSRCETVETEEAYTYDWATRMLACVAEGYVSVNGWIKDPDGNNNEVFTSPRIDVPATGHSWRLMQNEVLWTADSSKNPGDPDYFSVKGTWKCSGDNSHTHEKGAKTVGIKNINDPTCTQPGSCEYLATFESPDSEKNSDVTMTRNEIIPAKGHTEVLDEAVEPTCTEAGRTEGRHCSACKEVIVEQQKVSAKGHEYGSWEKLDENQHQRVCNYDAAHVETADHTWGEVVVTKKATTKATGIKTFTCRECKASKTEIIPKLTKKKNTLKVKGKTAKVKYKKLKKKTQTLQASKVIKFTKKGQGKKSYKKSTLTYTKARSVKMSKKALKKYRKQVAKKITINVNTGKVTLKKGLKRGTYKVKVKVKAAGNASYKTSGWKTVTFRIKVK